MYAQTVGNDIQQAQDAQSLDLMEDSKPKKTKERKMALRISASIFCEAVVGSWPTIPQYARPRDLTGGVCF